MIQNAPIREDIQPMPPVWSMWLQGLTKAVNGAQTALGYTPANVAGDTFTGPVAFHGVGFFGTAPVSVKPAAPAAATGLTSAFGVSAGALVDVGAAFNQANLNNNFQSLVTKATNLESRIASIYAAIQSLGLEA